MQRVVLLAHAKLHALLERRQLCPVVGLASRNRPTEAGSHSQPCVDPHAVTRFTVFGRAVDPDVNALGDLVLLLGVGCQSAFGQRLRLVNFEAVEHLVGR